MSQFADSFLMAGLGDSLFSGRLADWDRFYDQTMRAQAERPFRYVSAGRGSQTSAWGVTQIPHIAGLRPHGLLLSLAMNDAVTSSGITVATHESNYLSIINGVRANNPACRIFICTMNPIGAPGAPLRQYLEDYWQADRDLAAAEDLELVDINAVWKAAAGVVDFLPSSTVWFQSPNGEASGDDLHPAFAKQREIIVPTLVAATLPIVNGA